MQCTVQCIVQCAVVCRVARRTYELLSRLGAPSIGEITREVGGSGVEWSKVEQSRAELELGVECSIVEQSSRAVQSSVGELWSSSDHSGGAGKKVPICRGGAAPAAHGAPGNTRSPGGLTTEKKMKKFGWNER